jgi:RecA-family ATPase
MASGKDWHRWEAVNGPSVYVASEGFLGLSRRVNAWKSFHDMPRLDRCGVAFMGTSLRLIDPENVKRFTAEIAEKEPALVVIDTLARNTAGMEENSAKEMGQAVSGCDYIREQLGSTVLVIHHSGKTTPDSPKPRLRGSSALNGAADIIISAQMEGFNVTLRCDKCKEAARFQPITMSLLPVEDSLVLTL